MRTKNCHKNLKSLLAVLISGIMILEPAGQVLPVYAAETLEENETVSETEDIVTELVETDGAESVSEKTEDSDPVIDTPENTEPESNEIQVQAEESVDVELTEFEAASGTCGAGLTWTLDNAGTLTISGMGDMYDSNSSTDNTGWHGYKNNIIEVVVDEGVTSIGAYAFYKFTKLTTVNLPSSLLIISDHAFIGCTNLVLTELPSGVTSIGDYAFEGCTNLALTELPSGLTSIGEFSFCRCTSLTDITIPANLTSIEGSSFGGCKPISITVDAGNTVYDSRGNCNAIIKTGSDTLICGCQSTVIPNTVKMIGDYAFQGRSGLTSIEIPNSVIGIGQRAFSSCSGLTSIEIPNSVIFINGYAFEYCESLTSIEITNSVTVIGTGEFSNCKGLISISIPSGVISIQLYAFNSNSNLKSIYIPVSVEMIEEDAFYGCTSLADVYYEGSSTDWNSIVIGNYNENLTNAQIHYNSTGAVASGTCGANLTWTLSFAGKLTITGTGDMYDSDSSTDNTGWRGYKDDITEVVVGEGVTSIGVYAFYNFANLATVNLPSSLLTIADNAFPYCYHLALTELPSNLTGIGGYAFSGCNSLALTELPSSLTNIGIEAFYNCPRLKLTQLPPNITSIDSGTFKGCTDLTNITIPASVTSIAYDSFWGCAGLTSITVDARNTVYDSRGGCNAIIETGSDTLVYGCQSTVIPNTVKKIGRSAFRLCSGLTSIKIPNSVTEIGDYAFAYCEGLTIVNISAGVTIIGACAFLGIAYSSNLKSIYIPVTVETIGNSAFEKCTSLADVYYGGSNTEWDSIDIGSNNENLTNAQIHYNSIATIASGTCGAGLTWTLDNAGTLAITGTGDMYESNDTTDNTGWHGYAEDIAEVVVGEGVTSIGAYAFYICTNLAAAELPSSVTSIGEAAFFGCISLALTGLPSGVTSIGDAAFGDCTSLALTELPSGVTSIGDSVFYSCTSLALTELPSSVTSIGASAFSRCTSLALTELPAGVTSIGEDAFSNCTSLALTELPPGVTNIGEYTFSGCTSLALTELPSGVTNIGEAAFYNCTSLRLTQLPSNLTSIKILTFANCISLTSITIPANVASIEYTAFMGCELTSITVDAGNTVYDSRGNCNAIIETGSDTLVYGCQSTVIPNTVKKIGESAFNGISNLESIYIPATVERIGDSAFGDCTSLADVYYGGSNTEWNSIDIGSDNENLINALIHYNSTTTIASGTCGDDLTWTLDEAGTLTITGSGEMYDSSNATDNTGWRGYAEDIAEVVVGEGVTSIGTYAFGDCTDLATVNLPSSLLTIGYSAFVGCKNLAVIELPSNLTDIGDMAMGGTGLTDITIPAGVTSIELNPFDGCEGLTRITVDAGNTVYDSRGNCNAIIETGSDTLVSGCQSTVIPNTVKKIGMYAFSACYGLTSIEIPNSVTEIGEWAFYDCENLTGIIIPAGVTSIGNFAFDSCIGLAYVYYGGSSTEWNSVDIGVNNDNLTNAQIIFNDAAEITGTAGADIIWALSDDGVLTITGTGDICDSDSSTDNTGWREYKERVIKVVVGDGITGIGAYAFDGSYMTDVELPSGLTSIGEGAFYGCKQLRIVDLSDTKITTIPESCFENCDNLQAVYLPSTIETIRSKGFKGDGKVTVRIPAKEVSVATDAFEHGPNAKSEPGDGNVTFITYPDGAAGEFAGYYDIVVQNIIEKHLVVFVDYKGDTVKKLNVDHDFILTENDIPEPPAREGYEFVKWESDGEENQKIEIDSHILRDVTFSPVYNEKETSPKYYYVTFVDGLDNSQIGDVQEVEAGASAVAPEPSKHEGYKFVGWSTDEYKEVTKDVSVTALYEKENKPEHYRVTFIDGLDNSQIGDVQEVEAGASAVAPEPPKHDGYEFIGWSTDEYQNVTKDLTVTSLYAEKNGKYVVIFVDGIDGSQIGEKQQLDGGTLLVTPKAPVHSGYKFKKWSIAGYNHTTGELTIVALYEPEDSADDPPDVDKKYIITYALDGGKNTPSNPGSYDEESATIVLKDAEKTGYSFGGWYTDAAMKKKITKIVTGSHGSLMLHAKWIANSYTVRFNGNGANGSMKVLKCKYGSAVTLTTNKFKKGTSVFAGWNTSADGSGTSFMNRCIVENLTDAKNGEVILYAQWRDNAYPVNYYLNGGTNHPDNPNWYEPRSSAIELKDPVRKGYEFAGWYSDSGMKKKTDGIPEASKGKKNFYAKWTVNKYTVTFDGNGATSGKMAARNNKKYDKKFNLPANKYGRNGYTFVGWNTKPDGTGKAYKNKAKVSCLTSEAKGNVTLYAQWIEKEYKITYQLKGGKNNDDNPAYFTVSSETIKLADPTRDGYQFAGWYTDKKYKNMISQIVAGSVGDKTLFAKWVKN